MSPILKNHRFYFVASPHRHISLSPQLSNNPRSLYTIPYNGQVLGGDEDEDEETESETEILKNKKVTLFLPDNVKQILVVQFIKQEFIKSLRRVESPPSLEMNELD